MLIFQIVVEGNTGSTGTMAEGIGNMAIKRGYKSVIAYGRYPRESSSELIRIGNFFDILMHGLETRFFDRHGLGSRRATKNLIKTIDKLKPTLIHIHHIHGYYVNMKILFDY